jgi:hypothetical protein
MKSGNVNFLEPSGPLQACDGTALAFCRGWVFKWNDRLRCGVFPHFLSWQQSRRDVQWTITLWHYGRLVIDPASWSNKLNKISWSKRLSTKDLSLWWFTVQAAPKCPGGWWELIDCLGKASEIVLEWLSLWERYVDALQLYVTACKVVAPLEL